MSPDAHIYQSVVILCYTFLEFSFCVLNIGENGAVSQLNFEIDVCSKFVLRDFQSEKTVRTDFFEDHILLL